MALQQDLKLLHKSATLRHKSIHARHLQSVSGGISVNIDGSEDGDVHCLKDGGVSEDARVAIDRDTGTLLSGEDRDDSDPFEEEEDEDQLEEIDDF